MDLLLIALKKTNQIYFTNLILYYVLLYGTFAAIVKLSKGIITKEPILAGVSDLENKKFYKLNLSDFIEKPYLTNNLKFRYYIKDKTKANNFLLLENRSGFKYYEINGEIPFFDSLFNIKYKNLRYYVTSTTRILHIY